MSCILAIDDRPINLQFLASLLGYGGHKILQASDGEEGLAIARESHPDLIVTDIKMPKMDGYEFVDQLRQEPAIATTPVIFYTALYHELEAKVVADSYGVTDIIAKPSEPEEILRKVNSALGRWGSQNTGIRGRSDLETLQATGLKLSALVELGMELSSERDVKRLLSRFCSTAIHISGARKSMLGILSEDGNELKHFLINGLKASHPIVHDEPPVHHSVLESIVTDRKVVRINHAEENLHLRELSPNNSPIHSFLGVPLMSATQTYGWLVLLEKHDNSEFSEDDERMATTLAAQAAIAYENAVFSDRLERNAEELDRTRREQLEMKDEFISNVSHELRSPLSVMHQFTTILLDGLAGEINADQKEYLEIIVRNEIQLGEMISDLLEATRAQTNKLTIEPRSIALTEVLQPILQTYEKRVAEKGIAFCSSTPPDLPNVLGDPNRIAQVLSNLLDNALKFTRSGTISVSCTAEAEPGFIRIAVSDTGCGVNVESLNLVFDRLYQAPDSREACRRGLGLGLYICRQLVGLHGGRIWGESEVEKGSTFSFTIPISKDISEEGNRHGQQ